MRLTKAVVEAARYQGSDGARHVLWDTGSGSVAGLGCRVYPSGRRAFVYAYRAGSRQRLMVLGTFPDLGVQAARDKARKLAAAVLEGRDPLGDRQRRAEAPALADLWERYLEEYAGPRLKPRTVRELKGTWSRYLAKPLGARKLEEVTRQDVARLHHRLGERNKWGANDALKLLRRLYRQAAEWGLVPPGVSPALYVKLYAEPARRRYLSGDELRRLGRALADAERDGEDLQAVAAVRLLVFTGARAGEILRLRWREVDLQAQQLRLEDSKTGPKDLELPAPAVEVLAGLAALRHSSGSPWVFPGRNTAQPRNDYIKRAWQRLCARAGLADCRLHDLRHTFASTGAAGGFSLLMIGELLGHRQTSTTERYSHLSRTPRQEAAKRIAGALAAALAGSRGGDVVALRSEG